MPRVELPSKQADGTPNYVEFTESLMSGTRFDVKDAVKYVLRADDEGRATQTVPGGNDDRQRVALWYNVITDWSFKDKGIPVPSQNAAGKDGAADLIGSTLDLDDFAALAEATQPLLDKVLANPKRARQSPS